ncbi:MAG: CGGC domain-containing protein [Defluviitaleaceae bacterium]|nr:CGGC domain-containing protein [Defluviitaleaceae bacterium]
MHKEYIGIVTCSNAVNDLDCCSAPCLHDFECRTGKFSDYDKANSSLVGIISCCGCPTLGYPEKIMRKINALVEFKVTAIHFSFCMVALCPFINKYIEIISSKYPEIKLVKGTHEERLTCEQFRDYVKAAFDGGYKMNDIIKRRIP